MSMLWIMCHKQHVRGQICYIIIWNTSKMPNKKLTSAPLLKTLYPTTETFMYIPIHWTHFKAKFRPSALQPDPKDIPKISHDDNPCVLCPSNTCQKLGEFIVLGEVLLQNFNASSTPDMAWLVSCMQYLSVYIICFSLVS